MENWLGLLRIHIKRGVNLAIRDSTTSDPYVLLKLGDQKLKTRVVTRSLNPEWNDLLTLPITDVNTPIKLFVCDKDTFSFDDKMGDSEFEIGAYLKALKMQLHGFSDGTIISKVQPNRHNCLAEESHIVFSEGSVVQNMVLRLRNVECGEIELQLQWIDVPISRGL